MVIFLLFLLVVLAIIVVLGISIFVGLIAAHGVPFVSTPRRNYDAILKAAEVRPGETVFDLGCGKASLLIRAAKKYGAKGAGYEISLWPYLWARFNIWIHRASVKMFFKNFFRADLSEADVVFCYLFAEVMAKLEPKFQKELKAGARVVSYAFKLPKVQPVKEVVTNDDHAELGKIYVYRF